MLSKESLRRFHRGIAEKSSFCQLNRFRRNEDMFMGDCLSSQGVYQGKSIDDFNRQRFHPLAYTDHFHGNFPQWFKDFSEDRHLKVFELDIYPLLRCSSFFRKDRIAVVIVQLLFIMSILI